MSSEVAVTQRRFASLDVFRGAAVVAMILVNNPGDRSVTFAPLLHSEWEGWRFADTVFPAFLWVAGFALALSMESRNARGDTHAHMLAAAARRAAILFLCGLFLEGLPYFDLSSYQVTGVLQKIAISWLLAYVVCLFTDWRGRIAAVLALFAAYIFLMLGLHVRDCGSGPWSAACNAARFLNERELHGHLWDGPSHNDPDGIVGTVIATASVLIGALAGQMFRRAHPGSRRRLLGLASLALGLVAAGYAATPWIPINKALWTPSFTLLTAGLSCGAFAACFWVVDELGLRRFTKPLEIFGMNALVAYMLSRIVASVLKVHVRHETIYHDVLVPLLGPSMASLGYALVHVAAVFVVVWIMYRRHIFVKF